MVVPFSFFYSFSCPDEEHAGGWVEGIREEARVEGVAVVVEQEGGVCLIRPSHPANNFCQVPRGSLMSPTDTAEGEIPAPAH